MSSKLDWLDALRHPLSALTRPTRKQEVPPKQGLTPTEQAKLGPPPAKPTFVPPDIGSAAQSNTVAGYAGITGLGMLNKAADKALAEAEYNARIKELSERISAKQARVLEELSRQHVEALTQTKVTVDPSPKVDLEALREQAIHEIGRIENTRFVGQPLMTEGERILTLEKQVQELQDTVRAMQLSVTEGFYFDEDET